jgi:hypothetical protein
MNQLSQLEDRLTRLERQVLEQRQSLHRSRMACGILAVALLGTIGLAATVHRPVDRVIQAHRFEVLDENNRLVAAFGVGDFGGQLDLWNGDGRNVLRAAATEPGGDVTIWNAHGVAVYGVYATDSGSEAAHWNAAGKASAVVASDDAGGQFHLLADVGQPTVKLASTERGGDITTHFAGGDISSSLASGEAGGSIAIHSSAGRPIVVADVEEGEHGRLRIADRTGAFRLTASTDSGGGRLDLSNSDGISVWNAGASQAHGSGYLRLSNRLSDRILAAGGTAENAGQLTIFTQDRKPAVVADAVSGRGGLIALLDTHGTRMFVASAQEHGGLMNMMDMDGVPVFVAGYSAEGRGGGVSLRNTRGVETVHVGTDETEGGAIHIWDADGQRARRIRPLD